MRVYRIAREKTGELFPIGPYKYYPRGDIPTEIQDMANRHTDSHHPTPMRESNWKYETHPWDVCCFTDELQLMEWFDGYLDMLHELQFRVYVYDVPEIAVMRFTYQSVADTEFMRYVSDYAICAGG